MPSGTYTRPRLTTSQTGSASMASPRKIIFPVACRPETAQDFEEYQVLSGPPGPHDGAYLPGINREAGCRARGRTALMDQAQVLRLQQGLGTIIKLMRPLSTIYYALRGWGRERG